MANIPNGSALPYLVANLNSDNAFAFFGNGAIRRVSSATEMVYLTKELGVRRIDITQAESGPMAAVSMRLFGF